MDKKLRGKKTFFAKRRIIITAIMLFVTALIPSAAVFATDYSITMTTSGSVNINSTSGTASIDSSDINVITNCRAGYNLSLGTSVNDNNLYLDGDSSNNATDTYITPSNGTSALKDAPNTWGYFASFGASPIVPTKNNIFSPVPTLANDPTILRTPAETASDSDIDDTFKVYYGANAGLGLTAGTYRMITDSTTNQAGGLTYYVTANPTCTINLDITFAQNAGEDTVTNFPTSSDNTLDSLNNTLTLSDKVPVRSGYVFTEWNTSSNGTGTAFAAGETITIGAGTGELSGDVTLYAIWELDPACPAGYICYHGNGADAGTMDNQSASSNTKTILIASNYSRAGYGFAGWSTVSDITDTTVTPYGPNATITTPDLSSEGLKLYAKWVRKSGNLQTWSSCSTMNTGDVIALRDVRDDEVYTVSKLADNNCWITENLRLVPSTTNISVLNTNNPTSAFITATPSSSSTTSQCAQDSAACDDQVYYYTGNMDRTKTQQPTGNDAQYAWYSYGSMYNWYTATAGNGIYTQTSGNVAGDICPAGWRLPTGDSSGEYTALSTALGGTSSTGAANLHAYPNNFINSGDYNPSSEIPDGRGTQGRIWSATPQNAAKSYRMGYNNTSITPSGTWNKWDNFAVRCIYQGGNIPYLDLTVDFEDAGISSVSFTNSNYGTVTATPANPTATIVDNVTYTITATPATGYHFSSWATDEYGTLGSDTTNPTTYIVTDEATLSVASTIIPTYATTVTLGEHITSVSFTNASYGTQTITNNNGNQDGTDTGTVNLREGVEYTITATFANGYKLNAWTNGANSTIGSTSISPTTFTITGASTLSVTATEADTTTYTLVYDAGSGTDAPASETATSQNATHDFTITNLAPIYYGYTFTGWTETLNSTTVDYTSGDTITVPSTGATTTKTLYAVYQQNTCQPGKICYYDNGADVNNGGRNTMSNQNVSSNSSANLIPSNYSRTGYGFAGWTTSANATPYGPNATITTGDLSSQGLALYAKWVAPTGNLHDWNGCNSLQTGDVIALTDTRDNNVYTVAKLADNNCWTTENLRLVPSTATINTNNTHNPTSSFISEAASSSSSTTMCKADSDTTCLNSVQFNANSLNRTFTPSYNTAASNVGWYSYGVYYNWYTATAGNGTYETTGNTTVNGDICPKKWHIPTGNNGEWVTLNNAANGSTSSDTGLRAYPVNLIWSGDYNNTKRTSGYSNGRMWSSTANANATAYRMGYASNTVTPNNSYNKWDGFAIRCVYDGDTVDYSDLTVTLPTGVESITFTNAVYGTETATTNSPTVSLAEGASYTITATFSAGYEFGAWTNGENSTIGNASENPTTIVITDDTTLTLTATEIPSYTVTVTMDTNTSSISFTNSTYPTQTATNSNVGTSSDTATVSLRRDATYTITATTATGYEFSSWSTTSGGTLGSTSTNPTTYTTTSNTTLTVTSTPQSFTCTKQYRLQNADGTYPENYITDGTESINYNGTCSYTKSETNYTTQSSSETITSDTTISLDLPRTTYELTINKNDSYISSVTGAGTYRWGEEVSISATPATGGSFTTWSQTSGTTSTFGDAASATTTFTMPTSPATIYANGKDVGILINYDGNGLYYNNDPTDTNNPVYYVNTNSLVRVSGTYQTPSSSTSHNFLGWSEDQNATTATYADEQAIIANSNYTHSNSPVTLYAIYQSASEVTVNFDEHVTSITFTAEGKDPQTITTSGGTVEMWKDTPYIITAAHATGYATDTWTTTSNGTISSPNSSTTTYTITGDATLSLTSKQLTPMQSFTITQCNTMNTSDTTQLLDSRDNTIYNISKLADGNCWLLDNLALDLTDPSVQANLNSNTTNATDESINYLINGGGTESDKYAITGVSEWSNSPLYSESRSYTDPLIASSGDCRTTPFGNNDFGVSELNCANDPENGKWTKSSIPKYNNVEKKYGNGNGKIGIYYNICAASAGSYCYPSYLGHDNVSEDICPAGWRIPIGGTSSATSNEYRNLINSYPSKIATDSNSPQYALSTPLSGDFITDGKASRQGYNGRFWSSAYYGTGTIYSASVNESWAYGDVPEARNVGFSIRCLLSRPADYTLSFNANSTDAIANLPSSITETDSKGYHNFTIPTSSIPSRTNYNFIGYSTTEGANTADYAYDKTNNIFTPDTTSSVFASSPSITLYAVWEEKNEMQNYSLASCPTEGITLTDNRDGEKYLVKKLADGNCWMLDNLRFSDTNYEMTPEDTNIAEGTTYQFPNTVDNWTSSSQNSYTEPLIESAYKNDTATGYGDGSKKIGTYYNYCAASAGTYCYDQDGDENHSNASYDVCPAGWRLPTGSTTGEYSSLCDATKGSACNGSWNISASSTSSLQYQLSTPLSGYFSGYQVSKNSYGRFWASTYSGNSYMYYMYQTSSYLYPRSSGSRNNGNSIRCILMPKINYSLNFNSNTEDEVTNLPANISKTIQRDNGYSISIPTNSIPTREGYDFAGYSTGSDDIVPTYKYQNNIFIPNKIDYTKTNTSTTLYAIWVKKYDVTFNTDGHILSIDLIEPNGKVSSTIDFSTKTTETITLNYPYTYAFRIKYANGYMTDSITKTSGVGTLTNLPPTEATFEMGEGSATIDITSASISLMQNFSSCSTMNEGDTTYVHDIRDHEVYMIGKFKDGKCWMMDNLRTDLVDEATRANLTSTTTNATDELLNLLKNGGTTNKDGYTTTAVRNNSQISSNTEPIINNANKNTRHTEDYTFGIGANKTGVTYNYCALTAGEICHNPSGYEKSSHSPAYDICPAGWRLATGGSISEYQNLVSLYDYSDATNPNSIQYSLSTYAGEIHWTGTYIVGNGGYTVNTHQFTPSSISIVTMSRSSLQSSRCVLRESTTISLDLDEHITSVDFVNPDDGAIYTTANKNDTSINLEYNWTYKIVPHFEAGYALDEISKTSGDGTLDGDKYTVAQNTGVISISAKTIVSMQSFASCDELAIGDTVELQDNRDSEIYLIGKLQDGKCWMLDNLRLDLTTATNLNDTNTNASNEDLNNLMNGLNNNKIGKARSAVKKSPNNDMYNPTVYTALKNNEQKTIDDRTVKNGVYYDYCALTAGTYCETSGASSTDAYADICPAGWRLPTGYQSNSEFGALLNQYNTLASFRTAFNDVYFGFVTPGGTYTNGYNTATYYMSSSYANSSNMSGLYLYSSNTTAQYAQQYRQFSTPARCIKQDDKLIPITFDNNIASVVIYIPDSNVAYKTVTTSGDSVRLEENKEYVVRPIYKNGYTLNQVTVNYGGDDQTGSTFTANSSVNGINVSSKSIPSMQNWFGCSTLKIGDTLTLRDTRDNELYMVSKLKDGECWMLDNLRFDDTSVTLNSDNTDITSDRTYSLPHASGSWTSEEQNSYTDAYIDSSGKNSTSSYYYGVGSGKTGTFYNYCAASAGSYCYDSENGIDDSKQDICPAGWKLPTGHNLGELQNYISSYSNHNQAYHGLSATISGFFENGNHAMSNTSTIEGGFFWASTRSSSATTQLSNMEGLYVFEFGTASGFANARNSGLSVRCLARDPYTEITFNGNGADSGSTQGQFIEKNSSDVLSSNGFTKQGYTFVGWNTRPDGSGQFYANNSQYRVYNISSNTSITLYAQWQEEVDCDDEKLCVIYHGNGLKFDNNDQINTVNYNVEDDRVFVTKYSHTSNIDDSGTASDKYSNNLATKNVVSIPGATKLNVTLYYSTENNYDQVFPIKGNYTGAVTRNMSVSGQLGTYQGGAKTTFADATRTSFTVDGDTITFAFYSDSSNVYYGYYAVITAVIGPRTVTPVDGTYKDPVYSNNQSYRGWSENPNAFLPTYTDETDINNNLNAQNGDKVTLYATYSNPHQVTINFDEHVNSVSIYNANYGTQIVTTSGSTITLYDRTDYIITSSYANGYGTDTWSATSTATIGNPNTPATSFIIYDDTTLTLTSKSKSGTATLDTGSNLNVKMKTLAEGMTKNYYDTSSKIKAIRMVTYLPAGFTPTTANTVSTSNSTYPIYIFFDNTNDAGIMYFYTEATTIYMNSNSDNAFYNNTALIDISALASWNTDNVQYLNNVFLADSSLTDLSPIANWNTKTVTQMNSTFSNMTALTDISPLANWNTSSVQSLNATFANDPNLSNISILENWSVSNVTGMQSLFYNTSISDLTPIANWDISKLNYAGSMFSNTKITSTTALSNWSTNNVTNMDNMFTGATLLSDISALSNWNTSSVTSMRYMFSNTSVLTDPSPINDWDITKVQATMNDSTYDNKFYHIFYHAGNSSTSAIHPEFTKRSGSWDSDGTFIPSDTTVPAIDAVYVTINFGDHVRSVGFYSSTYGTVQATHYNPTIRIAKNTSYTISASFEKGIAFGSWSTTVNGALGDATSASTTYTVTDATTLTINSVDNRIYVNYDGNGLYYNNDPTDTVNTVGYYSKTTSTTETVTKYAHSSNVKDSGTASGTYSNNVTTTDTVTIDGATSLNVTVYYDTESTSYDWVSVYQSPFNISNTNDATASTSTGNLSGKLAGRNSSRTVQYTSWYSKSFTVTGDTVKFHFRTDGSQVYYGYYAIITATTTTTNTTTNRASGSYITPSSSSLHTFLGWSENPNATIPTYTNEQDFLANTTYTHNDSPVTLYAVYNIPQLVTVEVTMDSNVTSVSFSNPKHPTQYITTNGATINLYDNTDYLITATFANGHTFGSWSVGTNSTVRDATANPTVYTVAGASTLAVASEVIPTHTVTVDLPTGVANITFTNNDYGIQTVNTDGGTVTLYHGIPYTVNTTLDTNSNFAFMKWTTTSNGVLANNTDNPTTYTVTGDATLTPNVASLVTVNLGSGVSSVTFCKPPYPNQTATVSGSTVKLIGGEAYTITARLDNGYEFTSWATAANGTLGSTTSNPTTYTVTNPSALTVTATAIPTHTVTVYIDSNVTGVSFSNQKYATETVNANGGTVTLREGVLYQVSSSYNTGFTAGTWTTTANGTLSNTDQSNNTFIITGDATISLTSRAEVPTTLLPGQELNAKMKTLAEGTDTTSVTSSSKIKSLQMSNSLPDGFIASDANTVSTADSQYPIYIFFDNTNDSGIMYFYTEASDIYMNEDSRQAFYYNTALTDISALASWNTSKVTNTARMFGEATSLTNINALSNWNTSNVVNMGAMFYYASNLTNIEGVRNWDISNVTTVFEGFSSTGGMFSHTSIANTDALTNWDISSMDIFDAMFDGITSLTDISALANWDISSVTNTYRMFANTTSLTDISALANWDTSNITGMGGMFNGARSLTNLDALSNWDTSNVRYMGGSMSGGLFANATSLTDISALANWDTSSVTDMWALFANTTSLTDISALANWDTSSVIDMSLVFDGATSLTNIDALSNWDTSKVTNMTQLFAHTSITNTNALANWDTSSVTSMWNVFYYTHSLTNIDALSNWNTSNVTTMLQMFSNADSLTDISALANWNTSSVTDMRSMFLNTSSLTGASAINNWDVRAVIATIGDSSYDNNQFYHMFGNAGGSSTNPIHPEFTTRSGTWNSEGTFIPDGSDDDIIVPDDSGDDVMVTVNFSETTIIAEVDKVMFSDGSTTQTVTRSGDVVYLDPSVTYTIVATFNEGFGFASWSSSVGGTLGNASSNPTTYQATRDTTLTINSQESSTPSSTATVIVELADHANSVTFRNGSSTKTASRNNPTVTLDVNTAYTITASFDNGWVLNSWQTSAGGTLGSTTTNPTTYSVSNISTLTVNSKATDSNGTNNTNNTNNPNSISPSSTPNRAFASALNEGTTNTSANGNTNSASANNSTAPSSADPSSTTTDPQGAFSENKANSQSDAELEEETAALILPTEAPANLGPALLIAAATSALTGATLLALNVAKKDDDEDDEVDD